MGLGRRFLVFLVFFFSSISFAAQPHINMAWPNDLGPLNPHLYSPNQMFAQSMVYEPLVKYKEGGEIIPWLAESWSVSDDGRSYTFKLREDVQFSNGEPFNAEAVVLNFDAILENRQRHSWLESANQLKGARALDEYTVQIDLHQSYYPLLLELSFIRPFRFIAPSQFIDGGTVNGIEKPIGTGPWVLTDSKLSQEYRFERNAHYWSDAPIYDSVGIKIMPDPNTRAIALETGEIDFIYGVAGPISPDTFERFKQMGVMQAKLSEPAETLMLAINTNKEGTDDLAVRRAINHAVNKDKIIESILYGTQIKANTLFSKNLPYTDIDLVAYDYDLDQAKTILDNAGWKLEPGKKYRSKDGVPLRTELVFVGTDAVYKAISEVIQSELAKAGIEVILIGEEESSVFARQRDGRFGMIFNRTWGAPSDPHAFVSSMRTPAHADYQAQLGLPDKEEIDQLITSVFSITDDDKRQEVYTDILTRLHEQAVYLPLTYIPVIGISNPTVAEFSFGALSNEIPFEQFKPAQ